MDKLIIRGGVSLRGEVEVSGAKNAALPAMAACLLTDAPISLQRVPRLGDVRTIVALLSHLGVKAEVSQEALTLCAAGVSQFEAPYKLVKTMRASVLVLGPLVARFGRARVSLPGGCAIGPRPINLHLAGLEKMGAEISLDAGYVEAKASRLKGARIAFDVQTVTGTENLMMAASLADGVTVLENAACEPEVTDLAVLLNRMGARIEGAGTSTITVEGVESLQGALHEVIPDRVETGTFMVAAAITGGDVTINGCLPRHLEAVSNKLHEAGIGVEEGDRSLRVWADGPARGVNVRTHPYPGFATDMQAQVMALMATAEGTSVRRQVACPVRIEEVAGDDQHVDVQLDRLVDHPPEGGEVLACQVTPVAPGRVAVEVAVGGVEERQTAVRQMLDLHRSRLRYASRQCLT